MILEDFEFQKDDDGKEFAVFKMLDGAQFSVNVIPPQTSERVFTSVKFLRFSVPLEDWNYFKTAMSERLADVDEHVQVYLKRQGY